nr:MAG TPA: hypothetical protein [Bacteriophage sp.]
MGKIFDNSVLDAKKENTKEKTARFNAAERQRLAKQLEGEIYGDNRSEMSKLIARAEAAAAADMVGVYADYVVKYTFAELRKFRRRYLSVCENDVCRIDGKLAVVVTLRPVLKIGERYYYKEIADKPLAREAAKVVRRLWLGRQITNGFSFVPSQTEKGGEKVLEKKPVTDLHTAFRSMQLSATALDWAKIEQAAKERKAEEERTNEVETLRIKLLSGKATPDEVARFAVLAK